MHSMGKRLWKFESNKDLKFLRLVFNSTDVLGCIFSNFLLLVIIWKHTVVCGGKPERMSV